MHTIPLALGISEVRPCVSANAQACNICLVSPPAVNATGLSSTFQSAACLNEKSGPAYTLELKQQTSILVRLLREPIQVLNTLYVNENLCSLISRLDYDSRVIDWDEVY